MAIMGVVLVEAGDDRAVQIVGEADAVVAGRAPAGRSEYLQGELLRKWRADRLLKWHGKLVAQHLLRLARSVESRDPHRQFTLKAVDSSGLDMYREVALRVHFHIHLF